MSTKNTINLPNTNPATVLMELERHLDISLVHMTVVTTIRIDHNSGAKEYWMVVGDKLRKVEVSTLPNSTVEG